MKSQYANSGRPFAKNVVWNVLALAAPLVFSFLATPLIIRGLGVEDYGYYSLVMAVIGFAFTTGIGRIPAKYVPEKRVVKDSDELSSLLSAAMLFTLAVATAQAIILVLGSGFLISTILKVPAEHSDELSTAIFLSCLIGATAMISLVFQSTLQGVHRFRPFALITVAAALVINIGSAMLAMNDFPYTNIFILNLIVTVVGAAAFFVFARVNVPELRIEKVMDLDAVKKVGWFAASIFVYQSITSVFYLFERAYIVRNYGAEVLTYYTIPLMLGIYLHGLILAFSQVAVPMFNERVSDQPALKATYATLTKLVVSSGIFLALMYYSVGGELLNFWLGADFTSRSHELLVIDGVSFALIAILIPAWILSEAARKPGINASSPVVTYIVGIIAIIFLGSIYGPNGVAFGRLIGALAALPIIPIVERLVFGRILSDLWLAILARAGLASTVLFVLDKLITTAFGETPLAFTVSLVVMTSSFWAVMLLLGFIDRAEISSAFARPISSNPNSEMFDAMR